MRALQRTDASHLRLLERQLKRIESGQEMGTIDSDACGDKETSCTWGACASDVEAWPDPVDMLWPEQHPGRISAKYRADHHRCPLDRWDHIESGQSEVMVGRSMGCYYRCRVFSPRGEKLVRSKALSLYRETIDEASP